MAKQDSAPQQRDEHRLVEERRRKLQQWRAQGAAYPNDFRPRHKAQWVARSVPRAKPRAGRVMARQDSAPQLRDEHRLVEERRRKLQQWRAQGVAYPNDFRPRHKAQWVQDQYREQSREQGV